MTDIDDGNFNFFVEFIEERGAVEFGRHLKSGSGNAFAKDHFH